MDTPDTPINYDDDSLLAEEVDSQHNQENHSLEEEEEVSETESLSGPEVQQNDITRTNDGSNNTLSTSALSKSTFRERIVFNIKDARYDVVKIVGKKDMRWTLSTKPNEDWDVCWIDKTVPVETLAKMLPYQKINHFPGIVAIARKNTLGRNLMRMRKAFPANFKFFPKTYLLPTDYQDFKNQYHKNKKAKTFIVKPEAGSQGRGIYLTKRTDTLNHKDKCVVQKYVTDPYLIDDLKFDMRLYVLLAGCDPLRIYLHKEGLGRFATEPYVIPTDDNMDNVCMHLTNYAINKDSPNFVFNNNSDADDVGHKKSVTAVFKILKEQGHDTDKLWAEIKKIIIKTFCSVQPTLAHNYRSCHPNEPYSNMCFEILGFDIMLDSKLKPWLIEVNHLPSFTTDTPLDKSIKRKVIGDALKLMNVSSKHRIEYKNKRKQQLHQRAMTPKKIRMTPDERQAAIDAAQKERDAWESVNNGDFERLYPLTEEEKMSGKHENYEDYIQVAKQNWQIWTGTETKKGRFSKNFDINPDISIVDTDAQSMKSWNTTTRITTSLYSSYTLSSPIMASPKYLSRNPSKKNTSTSSKSKLQNDLSKESVASYKTATSSRIDIREGNIGPWCQEHISENSDGDSFDNGLSSKSKVPEERVSPPCRNGSRDENIYNRMSKQEQLNQQYQEHLLTQSQYTGRRENQSKLSLNASREEKLDDLSMSRYTNRAKTPTSIYSKISKSPSTKASKLKKVESQAYMSDKRPNSPSAKLLQALNQRPKTPCLNRSKLETSSERIKYHLEIKGPQELRELKEAFENRTKKFKSPDHKKSVDLGKKSKTPKHISQPSYSGRSGASTPKSFFENSLLQYKRDASLIESPANKHSRQETLVNYIHSREVSISKREAMHNQRYVSPTRELNRPVSPIAKKLEFSVGPPPLDSKRNMGGSQTTSQPKKKNASPPKYKKSQKKPREDNKSPLNLTSVSLQRPHTTKNSKKKQKTSDNGQIGPLKVTLSLGKQSLRPNMAELEDKMRKLWPTGLGMVKQHPIRVETSVAQLTTKILSPQYLTVRLTKDQSAMESQTPRSVMLRKVMNQSVGPLGQDIYLHDL